MTCFSADPRNIILAISNENYRRYNLQTFANIFGKFPEKFVCNFYRATACNATHGIAVAILSVRLTVCPSVRQMRVL